MYAFCTQPLLCFPTVIETSPLYGNVVDYSLIVAKPGVDYIHVSSVSSANGENGLTIPIIENDIVEGPRMFQVNVYDDVLALLDDRKRRKRSAVNPFDDSASPTSYPCIRILIVDDDGKYTSAKEMYNINGYNISSVDEMKKED